MMHQDRILLRGLQYFSAHGAWEHEKLHGQRFVVDVDIVGDFRTAGRSDRLEDALDYTGAYTLVTAVMQGPSTDLLEALCHRVAMAVLTTFSCVAEVGVRVEKPGASLGGVAGSVAVEVWRDRSDVKSPSHKAYISLGSNIGDRHALLCSAVAMMANARELTVSALSGIYETTPVGSEGQSDFLNAVVGVETTERPEELLVTLQSIERLLGRVRIQTWGPRTLDADIITYGDERVAEQHLTIPHPRALERAFVMVPLAELDPCLVLDGQMTALEAALLLSQDGITKTSLVWPRDLIDLCNVRRSHDGER